MAIIEHEFLLMQIYSQVSDLRPDLKFPYNVVACKL